MSMVCRPLKVAKVGLVRGTGVHWVTRAVGIMAAALGRHHISVGFPLVTDVCCSCWTAEGLSNGSGHRQGLQRTTRRVVVIEYVRVLNMVRRSPRVERIFRCRFGQAGSFRACPTYSLLPFLHWRIDVAYNSVAGVNVAESRAFGNSEMSHEKRCFCPFEPRHNRLISRGKARLAAKLSSLITADQIILFSRPNCVIGLIPNALEVSPHDEPCMMN